MTFDEAMREAAQAAERAVERTLRKHLERGVVDEPEISTYFVSQLDSQFDGQIGGLKWTSSIVRNGPGSAAEEKRIGADILLHVSLDTPAQTYSKGVLIQAKKVEQGDLISAGELTRLRNQCLTMLDHTSAAFVLNFTRREMRCGPATRFSGTSDRRVHIQCTWACYRFFLELFRCPVGDPRITSASVPSLPVPSVIHLKAQGDLATS